MDYIRGGNYGIVFIEGEIWKERRKFAMQVFRNFGMGRGLMEEKVESEIELNPIPIIERTIANAINQMLFGFAFHSESQNEEYRILKTSLTTFLSLGASPSVVFGLNFPKIVPKLPYFKQQMNAFRGSYWEMRNYFEKIITEHKNEFKNRKEDSEAEDYVEAYLQEASKTSSSNFTDLINILIDLWGAGQETTANTCIFSLLYVLNNPKVQEKIHAELDSVIGSDRMVTLADKNSLIYVNAFINEVQRSVNLLPQNLFHKTTKDTKIGEFFIPKNTTIIPQISMVLLDENIFPEPEKFKPERFIEKNGNLKKFDELIPFSLGKRQCLGEALARMQIYLFVTNFYNQFKISSVDPKCPPSLKKNPGIAIQPTQFTCNIKKRFA
uniref:Cytochrome P450 n=1 Tax=Panagrolaimus davidi TaxID=227884 RepID=A0A914Q8V3_9BILA